MYLAEIDSSIGIVNWVRHPDVAVHGTYMCECEIVKRSTIVMDFRSYSTIFGTI